MITVIINEIPLARFHSSGLLHGPGYQGDINIHSVEQWGRSTQEVSELWGDSFLPSSENA